MYIGVTRRKPDSDWLLNYCKNYLISFQNKMKNLTAGSVASILRDENVSSPLLQVADIKIMNNSQCKSILIYFTPFFLFFYAFLII